MAIESKNNEMTDDSNFTYNQNGKDVSPKEQPTYEEWKKIKCFKFNERYETYYDEHRNGMSEQFVYEQYLKDDFSKVDQPKEDNEAVELLKRVYKLHPLREGQNILEAGVTFDEAMKIFKDIKIYLSKL